MTSQTYNLNGVKDFAFANPVRSASQLTVELVPGGVVSPGDYTVIGAGPTSTGVTVRFPNAPVSTTLQLKITRFTQPDRITVLNAPADLTVANLNAEFNNAYDAIQDFQITGIDIGDARDEAVAAAAAAQTAAAGVNLPGIQPGDAGKILRATVAEDGYELTPALLDGEVVSAKLADGAVTAGKLAAGLSVPVLLSTTNVTAVTSVDLPTVFSDNPSYKYYRLVIEEVGFANIRQLKLRVSVDGQTFVSAAIYNGATSIDVGNGVQVGLFRRAFVSGLFVNAGDTNAPKVFRGSGQVLRDSGSSSDTDYSVSAIIAANPALTGLQIIPDSAGTFRAEGQIKVYGSNTPF